MYYNKSSHNSPLQDPTSIHSTYYMRIWPTFALRSIALCEAPVWAENLTVCNISVLLESQRAMAVRLISGYRTISFEAANLAPGRRPGT